jgi:hypothetical protein
LIDHLTKKFVVLATGAVIFLGAASGVWCAEKWKGSFDDICSKVDASGTMTVPELSNLIVRLDKLAPEISASGDPAKKVYLQRLKKCRAMYQFMIDSKKE